MNSVLTSAVLTGDSTNMTPYIVLMVVVMEFVIYEVNWLKDL